MRWLKALLRVPQLIITVILLTSSASKWVDGFVPGTLLPEAAYHGLAACEVTMVVLLWTKYRKLAAAVLLLGVLVASGYLWVRPDGLANCGCLGGRFVARGVHMVLLGLLGMAAVCVTLGHGKERGQQQLCADVPN
jgi:hypothetical protein